MMAWHRVLILMLALAAGACAGNPVQRAATETLERWEAMVRWSQFDALVDFIHPDHLQTHPVTQLEIDRLGQFRVTEYRVGQVLTAADGQRLERRVRLRLYHVHSAQERRVDYHEVWRYDPDLRAWRLHSGLPDPRRN